MAILDSAAIAASLGVLFEDDIVSQINRSTPLLQVLPIQPANSGAIDWNVRVGTGKGGDIAEGADVAAINRDDKVPAHLDYVVYNETFGVTGLARARAAATGNPEALADLYGEELGDATERLAFGIAEDIYIGAAATEIVGLLSASGPLSATGTYANVSRVTYPQWASNVLANGGVGRALTLDLMRAARRTIYEASGVKPDLIVTTPALHAKYGSLLGNERRYMQDVRLRGQQIVLDGGYQVLEFDGIPVIEDVNCPDNHMLFLNSRSARLRSLPDPMGVDPQGLGMVGLAGSEEEQFGSPAARLRARINHLSTRGDRLEFQLVIYLQLQVRRCNEHADLTDLDATL